MSMEMPGYQPSQGEIQKAEDMMTPKEQRFSEKREKSDDRESRDTSLWMREEEVVKLTLETAYDEFKGYMSELGARCNDEALGIWSIPAGAADSNEYSFEALTKRISQRLADRAFDFSVESFSAITVIHAKGVDILLTAFGGVPALEEITVGFDHRLTLM